MVLVQFCPKQNCGQSFERGATPVVAGVEFSCKTIRKKRKLRNGFASNNSKGR